jgi:hypothetical protein
MIAIFVILSDNPYNTFSLTLGLLDGNSSP